MGVLSCQAIMGSTGQAAGSQSLASSQEASGGRGRALTCAGVSEHCLTLYDPLGKGHHLPGNKAEVSCLVHPTVMSQHGGKTE